ncbi:hypothetical protein Desor_5148 [Desulfosporosinus orientis DSM 765]|uniref:Uncharacterized protein n=1 Tax=Desulfosporosinus orientis (strain ATCC 19365 / DSM 765 / NCIMB 8382 / VKM B-1628 / Singapore I) TaxID=768706 RepID=G7WJV0_DESOD|nr:hypothetical protein [Desulfosporosinus orientis]AET70537.1 hypothetical protein Desor_5148 [Desulfosporosinus orientis DSM 765]
MNFDNIAELVHELAKNSNRSSLEIPQIKSNRAMTNSELNAIAKVFCQEQLLGHSAAAIMKPTLYWV